LDTKIITKTAIKSELRLRGWQYSLILGILSAFFPLFPVAAKQIFFTYGPLQLSVEVDSLEKFAFLGKIDPKLRFYLSQVNPQQQAEFRKALIQRHNLNPVQVARFFNSDLGEEILDVFGQFITLEGGGNGKYALRASIIQAAFEPNGLSLINVLRKLPTDVEIGGENILELIRYAKILVRSTVLLPNFIGELSAKEAASEDYVDYDAMRDLREYGRFGFKKEKWILTDQSRERAFYVLLYKPQQLRSQTTPVIIISHGLAAKPEDYAKRAEYLASHGYVVAIPQHIGSDFEHTQDVLNGLTKNFFTLNEFIDRPLDITFLLDELQKRNQTEFAGQLNLESVGVMGHSFGGYTALALAGAEIDFKHLQKDCESKFAYLDLARLLQCRALKLPQKVYNFRDPRVKAIAIRNAVNRSLFGPIGLSKVEIPVVFISGSYDPIAHPIFEQIYPFLWLKTPHKYFALEEGQAHVDFVQLDAGISQALNSLPELTFPNPDVLGSYKNTTMLAYFEVYLNHDMSFLPYLQASYSAYLSKKEPFKFYWISSASAKELQQAIRRFRIKEGLPINP
jgi:predicted dienelactone hydrolase